MILTQHNDNRRSGANLAETLLNPTTVNSPTFAKLFELPVTGAVYAQPLFVPDLMIGNQRRNVLYIATMHNMVYAFDADKQQPSLWERRLAPSIQLPDSQIGPLGYKDIVWEVGIVSTPVIDTDRGAIYLVTTSKQPNFIHQLWMLDIVTGNNLCCQTVPARSQERLQRRLRDRGGCPAAVHPLRSSEDRRST